MRMNSDAAASDWTFRTQVHFKSAAKGRRRMVEGAVPSPTPLVRGRVPRIARLLALAHRFAALIESGDVRDYADVARLAGVSRARVTQISSLAMLAPDLQDEIFGLPRTLHGPDAVLEKHVRPIAAVPDWTRQRAMWRALTDDVRTGGGAT